MATQTPNIAGSGYGNPYIDALISGAGWSNTIVPIRYAFMSGAVSAADSPTGGAYTAPEWISSDINFGLSPVFSALQAVCNVSFVRVDPTDSAIDIRLWKLPGSSLLQSELPATGLGTLDSFVGTASNYWASGPGSYTYSQILKQFGRTLGLAESHTGGAEGDRTQFPGVADGAANMLGTHNLNQGIWTMMSANGGWIEAPASVDWKGWQGTPMAFDIAALQRMYGANLSTRTGNDFYRIDFFNDDGWTCIWDAGGTDRIEYYGYANVHIDLRAAPLTGPNAGGYVSRVAGANTGFTIANGVVIEEARGDSGNDTLIGNDANNALAGGAGNDTIDGGAGVDTVDFWYSGNDATFAVVDGRIVVAHTGPSSSYGSQGIDVLSNVEVLRFGLGSTVIPLTHFNADIYLLWNPDLYAAWGRNTDMALQHYLTNGRLEGRPALFDPLAYIASYPDLIAAFGTNTDAALYHYINLGMAEGRHISFDPLRYLASHADLLRAFGNDPTRAAAHYITDGFAEGRRATFDAMSYIASYRDLMTAFGTNAAQATQHYITNGFAEGRRVTFDAAAYLASHADLLNAFGANTALAAQHYITNGRAEGRQINFNPMKYIASHADLITTFGPDTATAIQHYITNGFREGRALTFDAEFYMAKYADVQAAMVDYSEARRIESATQHYITNGYAEGRVATNEGDDVLVGSWMGESIKGGPGNDRITGNGGIDFLTGGSGADVFVYKSVNDTTTQTAYFNERITDFTAGIDKIDLSAIDANTATPQDDAFTVLLGHLALFTAPGQLRLDTDPTYGYVLWGNVDADADAEFAIVLTGWPAINFATDIIA